MSKHETRIRRLPAEEPQHFIVGHKLSKLQIQNLPRGTVLLRSNTDAGQGLPVLSEEQIRERIAEFEKAVVEANKKGPKRTAEDIAEELTAQLGRKIPSGAVTTVINRTVLPEDAEAIRKLYQNGLRVSEIAEELGLQSKKVTYTVQNLKRRGNL